MLCPNCKKGARVINSQEKDNQRLRQYRCDNCHTYIFTRESMIYHYRADEKMQEDYKRHSTKRGNEQRKINAGS